MGGAGAGAHVKGDLLNLRDAGVAPGVIVLAGVDPDDESLPLFATALVNRPGPRILIWTEEDLHALWKSSQDSVVARAIIDAGWYASEVSLEASTVVLGPERFLSRSGATPGGAGTPRENGQRPLSAGDPVARSRLRC